MGADAAEYAHRVADLARANDRISEMDVVRALGELAIVQWQAQGVAAAFAAWDEAGERLFACRGESELWRDLCVMYGHVSGYFTTLASTGKPPALPATEEPYVAPWPGMLLDLSVNRAPLYDADKDAYLATQLAMFAEAVGHDDRAAIWAPRASRHSGDPHQSTMASAAPQKQRAAAR